MSDQLSKEEFIAHIGPIRDDIKELVTLQRDANGRTGKLETRVAVLEDRSPGRVATMVSAVVSGVITGVGMFLGSKQ